MHIENYNVLIVERNFYDQPIDNLIKQYDEVRKVLRGKIDDYKTCLLYYAYFKCNNRLTAVVLSKQKALGGVSRVIQQIAFQGVVGVADDT